MNARNALSVAFELGKIRISLPVSLSALAAFILQSGYFSQNSFLLAAGVLLMSCASASVNHIQEKDIDTRMPRTMNRPLPTGKVTKPVAWLYAGLFAGTGSLLLIYTFSLTVLGITWITLLWYNLVYTPLKRVTAFAVIPGSITGALPPVIGWVAAGGNLIDGQIWLVSVFFFIGQIPHFWLLLMIFGEQYALAGLPSLNKLFTAEQIKHISFIWILATLGAAFTVAGYVITQKVVSIILLVYLLYLIFSLVNDFFIQSEFKPRPVFMKINILYLLMMFSLVAEGLLRS
jgi:protoheme IX farnesyltransferase